MYISYRRWFFISSRLTYFRGRLNDSRSAWGGSNLLTRSAVMGGYLYCTQVCIFMSLERTIIKNTQIYILSIYYINISLYVGVYNVYV